MNVEAVCPVCRSAHVVPIELRGAEYRCDDCEELFIVHPKAKVTDKPPRRRPRVVPLTPEAPKAAMVEPAEAAPPVPDDAIQSEPRRQPTRPAASRRPARVEEGDEDEDDDRPRPRRKQSSGGPGAVIIGVCVVGGIGLLVVLGGALGWWFLSSPSPVANTPPVAVPPAPAPAAPAPMKPAPAPMQPVPPAPPAPAPAKPEPPRVGIPNPVRPRPNPPAPPAPPAPLVENGVWRVTRDAGAYPRLPAGAPLAPIEAEASGLATAVVPALPSPFVALGSNSLPNHKRTVWDLRTRAVVGEMTGRLEISDTPTRPLALAPDGAHFAAIPRRIPHHGVEVWSFAEKRLRHLDLSSTVTWMEFVGPGRLLAHAPQTGGKKRFHLWDVTTGREERSFDGPDLLRRESTALSAGGAYVAVAGAMKVQVYDVRTGQLVGERGFPRFKEFSASNCQGLAFAPDGSALAGLFESGLTSWVAVWDIPGGQLVGQHEVTFDRAMVTGPRLARGRPLQALPDSSGWLVHGAVVVDRASGAMRHTLPALEGTPSARFVVAADHFGRFRGGPRSSFTLEPIPWEAIRAARPK